MSRPRPTAFSRWLDRFLDEKEIDLEEVIEVEGPEWGTNHMPIGVLVEHMKIASPHEQVAIKDMIVRIDFRNGDVRHYFKHLAKAIAR